VNDYRALGESLGLAVQICEDILALVREDPMTGRRPRHVLEEGHFSLPILLALAEDPSLTALLTGEKEGMEWDRIVDRIRQGQGLIRAVEICKQYAGQAEGAAVEAAGNDSSLAALCKLPERCLASLTLLLPVEPQVPPAAADLTLRLVS
jgi:heptaprenyl diphosphate synthase